MRGPNFAQKKIHLSHSFLKDSALLVSLSVCNMCYVHPYSGWCPAVLFVTYICDLQRMRKMEVSIVLEVADNSQV